MTLPDPVFPQHPELLDDVQDCDSDKAELEARGPYKPPVDRSAGLCAP